MSPTDSPTAQEFMRELAALRQPDAAGESPYAGIGMGRIFALAKEFRAMSPAEIERLLESDDHAVRVGAVRSQGRGLDAPRGRQARSPST